jgi:GT2 family glycosyltransferase
MFPREILDGFENKQLPEPFFMYAEDLLWCYRIRKAGYRIYYCADTSLVHLLGASSSQSVLQIKHQNEYDFMLKYYGWIYAKTLVFMRTLLYASSSGRDYAPEISRIYFKLFLKGKLN